MLLSHTGGTNDFHYSEYRYGYYNNPPGPIDPIPTMHQELAGLPPSNTPAIEVVRKPGSTWVYSPAGYTVLQAILINIYGKPFSEIMADLVLEPLHLRESTFDQPTPNALTPEIAAPYVTDEQPLASTSIRHGSVRRTYDHVYGARGTGDRGSEGLGGNATRPD